MDEVELTSEFALLIARGVSGKTPTAIDAAYAEWDDVFPYEREVMRRFRNVMDQIEEHFGVALPDTPFARKTLFYSLFGAIYRMAYSSIAITKKSTGTALKSATSKRIFGRGLSIQTGSAPKAVLDAAERRTTHLNSRKTIIAYLVKP
jgi:hypothetical protein